MSDEHTKLERLGREAEILEARLLRDVDALVRREPVQAAREVDARWPTQHAIAIGAAAGVAAFAVAWITVRVIRAFA
jgi:hypothetical protein